jgi:hypothetical protein
MFRDIIDWILHPRMMWKLHHLTEDEKFILREVVNSGGVIMICSGCGRPLKENISGDARYCQCKQPFTK